jgi:thiaminase
MDKNSFKGFNGEKNVLRDLLDKNYLYWIYLLIQLSEPNLKEMWTSICACTWSYYTN